MNQISLNRYPSHEYKLATSVTPQNRPAPAPLLPPSPCGPYKDPEACEVEDDHAEPELPVTLRAVRRLAWF
jgi:hypothetical protein